MDRPAGRSITAVSAAASIAAQGQREHSDDDDKDQGNPLSDTRSEGPNLPEEYLKDHGDSRYSEKPADHRLP